MEKRLREFLNSFFALEIVPGKRVRIPYWRNRRGIGRRIQGPFGGKGTPAQIKKATLAAAATAGVDLQKMTPAQIRAFMRQKRIGLDCSGFAFQVLDFLFPGFWQGLKMAPGRSRHPIRRFSAAALTAPENSRPVKKLSQIKVGDLLPFSFSRKKIDHVLVVVDKNDKEIVYAHSSSRTAKDGPHLGKIRIKDGEKRLEEQEWEEKDKEGKGLFLFVRGKARRIKRNG